MKNVEAVAKDDIMRVASGVLKDDNLNLAVIGPVRDEKGLKGALHVS
jgi:predicted Zn-dependent peptidase